MLDYNRIIDEYNNCDRLKTLISYMKDFDDVVRGLMEALKYHQVRTLGQLALNYYTNLSIVSPSHNMIRNFMPECYDDWCRTHYDLVVRKIIHPDDGSFYYGYTEAAYKEKDQSKLTPREHIYPPKFIQSIVYLEHKYFNFVYTPMEYFALCILQSQTTTATDEENMMFKQDGTLSAYQNHNVVLVDGNDPFDIKDLLLSYQHEPMLNITNHQFIGSFKDNKFFTHAKIQKQIIKQYTNKLADQSFVNFRGVL